MIHLPCSLAFVVVTVLLANKISTRLGYFCLGWFGFPLAACSLVHAWSDPYSGSLLAHLLVSYPAHALKYLCAVLFGVPMVVCVWILARSSKRARPTRCTVALDEQS